MCGTMLGCALIRRVGAVGVMFSFVFCGFFTPYASGFIWFGCQIFSSLLCCLPCLLTHHVNLNDGGGFNGEGWLECVV